MIMKWDTGVKYDVDCSICGEKITMDGEDLTGLQNEFGRIKEFVADKRCVCNGCSESEFNFSEN